MQELIVFAIVAAAAVFIGNQIIRASHGKKGCGTCPSSGGCDLAALMNKREKPFERLNSRRCESSAHSSSLSAS